MSKFLHIPQAAAIDQELIPRLDWDAFRRTLIEATTRYQAQLVALCACPPRAGALRLYGVLAHSASGTLSIAATEVEDVFPALTPACPAAQGFERELAEEWQVVPQGHPWLKPLRFHPPWHTGQAVSEGAMGVMPFYRVGGHEIHEVAVGPVHAGIIEPGHFRFQCHGERVLHLEISLGYQYRGIERRLVGGPDQRSMAYMETVAGDSTIGHALAHASLREALAGCRVTARAHALRAIALELERLANHTGDLGALANDIGYLPTSSYCGRLRGDYLNMTARLCGSRFGRGFLCPGGVVYDLDAARIEALLEHLQRVERDTRQAIEMLWGSASVLTRFEGIGALRREQALDLGLVGPVARACGVDLDARQDFPLGIYRFAHIPIAVMQSGDVFARAYVRWMEISHAINFIREQLSNLPGGSIWSQPEALAPNALAVTLIEGWRGRIAHLALTDERGAFLRYKIVDPSFFNWLGLALAMREQQISDFPLCNKSFNLSYCGHDL